MSKALYQFLYQNETLYGPPKPLVKTEVTHVQATEQPSLAQLTPEPVVAAPPPPKTDVQTFDIKHKILVLIDEKPDLSASDGVFLNKILGAIGLSTETVELLNLKGKKNMDFRPLLSDKKVSHIVSFGVPFLKVNIDVMLNRYDPKTAAGVWLLLSDSLQVVQADDAQKRALWNNLKVLFT